MRAKNSLKKLKIALAILTFLGISTGTFAQSGYQILEGNALNDAVYQNVKAGLPQYKGMNDLYIITIDNLKPLKVNNSAVVTDIKAIPDVLSYSFDMTDSKVMVVFTKPANKDYYTNDIHLANLKAVLAKHDMKMIANKLAVIKK